MSHRERSHLSLTNRLLLLAALIVVTTTALLLITSASGVYNLVVHQRGTRQAAYRDILVAELVGRLEGASGVVRTSAEDPGLTGDSVAEHRRALSSTAIDNAQYLEGLALLETSGTAIATWPADILAGTPRSVFEAPTLSAATPTFIWEPPADGSHPGRLWACAPLVTEKGGTRVLAGRVRTNFVAATLSELAELPGRPAAFVLDSSGKVIFGGGDVGAASPVTTLGAALVFEPESGSTHGGSVTVGGKHPLVGEYADVTSPEGLGWRVVVVENRRAAWTEMWSALMPGTLGWILALLLALGLSFVFVGGLTRPLRRLAQRATALASGVPVMPEEAAEDDEVGKLFEAFNSVVRRLDRVNDVAELLAVAAGSSEVLAGVTASITHMLPGADAEVLLVRDGDDLELAAAEGALEHREGLVFTTGEVPWLAEALETSEPVEVARVEGDPYFELHGADVETAVAAPLRSGSRVMGLAVVTGRAGRGKPAVERDTVRSFAAQASVALRNARLFEEERRSRVEAETLRAEIQRLTTPGDVEEALLDVGMMISDTVGFDASVVALCDRESYGLRASVDPEGERLWLAAWDQLAPDAGSTEPIFLVPDAAGEAADAALSHDHSGAALLMPLQRETGLAGMIVLLAAGSVQKPSARRMALVGTAARQASLAVENAYFYHQAKSRADNLETIFRISQAVGSSLQSRVVLNRVLDVVQKILSADAVMLMTYDAQRRHISVPMARGILHRDMLDATFRPGEDVPGRVFQTHEPERYDRISSADTRLLNLAASQGMESLLVVPLLARGRSIGVLLALSREPAAFTSNDLDLLRTFASQAALAIDTAEMFSREHDISKALQESILPARLPRIPRIEASSVYLPAGKEADIGGDYYDLFEAPDGRVVVSIGDVCGKGVAAATKTSMIRYAIRGMVVAGLDPGRVLAEVNDMLLAVGDATSIVTLWLGYIDTTTGALSYADGGHPPALLLRPSDGRIDRLSTTGALLGAVDGASWEVAEVSMEPGSTLLLYTDGVTEARNGTRFFGEGRVRRALRARGPASAVAQRLLAQVQRFAGEELRDDAAILVVGLEPTDAEAADVGTINDGNR